MSEDVGVGAGKLEENVRVWKNNDFLIDHVTDPRLRLSFSSFVVSLQTEIDILMCQ